MTGLTQKRIIRRDAAASALHFEIARNVRQIVYCWYSKIFYSYHISDFVINFSLSIYSQLCNYDNRVIFSISYWQWKFLPYSSFPCFITSYELDWSLIKKVNSLRYVKWADFSTSRKISIFIFIRTAADIYKLLLSVEGIKESDFGTQGLSLTQLYLYTDFFLKNFYFRCYKTRETWKLEEKSVSLVVPRKLE